MTTEQELELVSAAIAGIEAIINAVKSAKSGGVNPQQALDAITALHASLQANNDAADAALAAKFGAKP